MKMRLIILGIVFAGLTSCKPRLEKPTPFLDQKTMLELLTDIHILEATIKDHQQQNYKVDSTKLYTNAMYNQLFDKYGITTKDVEANLYYYTYYYKTFEEIYSTLAEDFKQQDSLASKDGGTNF